MKNKIICSILINFGIFVYGMDSKIYLLTELNDKEKKELLRKIRLIGQPNGYNLISEMNLKSKVIWLSPVNNSSIKQGYVKLWDIAGEHPVKDLDNRSIFWKNSFFKQDSLEDQVSDAIEKIPVMTVGQRNIISNLVHCLRSGKVQVCHDVKDFNEDCSCCLRLEDKVSGDIQGIPSMTAGQRQIVLNLVHCLRSGKVQIWQDVKDSHKDYSCCLQ